MGMWSDVVVVIDGDNFDSVENLHLYLKRSLKLPAHYGNNLDALWDCLTGHIELPLTLIVKSIDFGQSQIGGYLKLLLSVLERADNELDGFSFVAIEKNTNHP